MEQYQGMLKLFSRVYRVLLLNIIHLSHYYYKSHEKLQEKNHTSPYMNTYFHILIIYMINISKNVEIHTIKLYL